MNMEDIFAEAGRRIVARGTCVDIGPGIKPQTLAKFVTHLCVEPHIEYVERLARDRYPVMMLSAIDALPRLRPVDVVFLLDVIEHMDRAEGEAVLELAKVTGRQVVVFTPLGYLPQSYAEGEKDAWGMNGTYWQTHRSGWTPDDFPGWEIMVEPGAHEGRGAFVAIWSR